MNCPVIIPKCSKWINPPKQKAQCRKNKYRKPKLVNSLILTPLYVNLPSSSSQNGSSDGTSPEKMLLAASRAACAAASLPRLAATRACSGAGPSHASFPKTPLFLLPPTITVALQDLQAWRDWARCLALSVGSSFSDADGGPDSELLCRELNWLLEDAVEDYGKVRGLVGGDKDLVFVRVRAGLEELYGLWKERVEKRRPFQYLVGGQHWRDMVLAVQEGVLIPRPETEMIVDVVGEAVARNGRLGDGVWADLGTGSGAIGIGIARVLGGGGRVIATDVSSIAVAVARLNVERYGLQVSCLVN